jgi:pimeloyl-ACP methyl ester carboxylesterase
MQSRRCLLRVDGVDVHWVELGAADDSDPRPLVMIHGLADSHRTWSRIAPTLARGRRLLMVDLPGHGMSARPDASYAVAWHARVIARWLEEIGAIDVDVVGHSFGGGVAQHLLLESAVRVRRLALVAAGGLGRHVAWPIRLLGSTFVERFGQPWMAQGTRLTMRTIGSAFDRDDLEWLSRVNATPGTARSLSRTVRDVIALGGQKRALAQHVNEVERLPPIAIFWGAKDNVIPHAHADETLALLDGVHVVRFPESAHYPHRDAADAFARELARFFDAPIAMVPRVRRALVLRKKGRRETALLFARRLWSRASRKLRVAGRARLSA